MMDQMNVNADEISLRTYLLILWRRKVTIIVVSILCLVGVLFYQKRQPEDSAYFYVSQIFSLPMIDINMSLDSKVAIKEKIEAHLYDDHVAKILALNENKSFSFTIKVPSASDFINVGMIVSKENIPFAKDVLNALLKALCSEYEPIITAKIGNIDSEIKVKQQQIALLEKANQTIENSSRLSLSKSEQIQELMQKILNSGNSRRLEDVSDSEYVSFILHSTAIQQALMAADSYSGQFELQQIGNRKLIEGLLRDIEILKSQKLIVSNMRQLQKNKVSEFSFSHSVKKTVSFYVVVSLGVGVLIGFLKDYFYRLIKNVKEV